MIPQFVIDEYLSRKLADHRWVKDLTHEELDEALYSVSPRPQLNPEARLHQKACVLLGIANHQFGFWVDMGGGKTLIALELARYWINCGAVRRAIVQVKTDKAYPTWEAQMKRFKIDLPAVFLEGSSEQKWDQFNEFRDGLVFVAYPGLMAMASGMVSEKGRKKAWRELDDKLVKRLSHNLGALVWDESTCLGHHTSLIYKLNRRLAKVADFRYALAGRLFGRDPELAHSQYYLLDHGETLGETLGLFRAAFCDGTENDWVAIKKRKYVLDYKFRKNMMPEFVQLVQNCSITYAEADLPDLPAVQPVVEAVRLPEETEAYYQRLVDKIIVAKGNFREMENIFLRMRQLSSGFIGMKDDDTGEKLEVKFDENPKLERLLELLGELPEGRKAVIFYDFTTSGRWINTDLIKLKRKPAWVWSGTKDAKGELKRFTTDPSCTELIINNKIGAFSLDGLQHVANYTFFYESPVSVLEREQASRRVRRDGQDHHVFEYDLVVKNTMDEKILMFHQEGRELFAEMVKDPKLFFGR